MSEDEKNMMGADNNLNAMEAQEAASVSGGEKPQGTSEEQEAVIREEAEDAISQKMPQLLARLTDGQVVDNAAVASFLREQIGNRTLPDGLLAQLTFLAQDMARAIGMRSETGEASGLKNTTDMSDQGTMVATTTEKPDVDIDINNTLQNALDEMQNGVKLAFAEAPELPDGPAPVSGNGMSTTEKGNVIS